jgi:pimeloyl-ACP methyl ester carboxylesterase
VTYFSYNLNDPQSYSEQDSLQSISTSVEALHRTVAREIAACDGVTIDLVGHSNGGVVGLRYLMAYGPTTSEGSHIRHLVTLDSPVNGISLASISSLVQSAGLFGVDLSYLQNTSAIKDLIAAFNDSATSQRNINLARSLSGKVAVLTMGSDDDLIVPFPSASIPGFSSEWALGVVSSLCPMYADSCVGHNQILHDPGVVTKIAGFLGTGP